MCPNCDELMRKFGTSLGTVGHNLYNDRNKKLRIFAFVFLLGT